MNLGIIARFLCGNAAAVRRVAESQASLPVGILLVLMTAIARNYDQDYWRETWLWLFGPLLFSFFSGTFLFSVVYRWFIRHHLAEGERPAIRQQWLGFMGLFWMTAPIAWVYAIPVERWMDSYHAARANLVLLGLVSAWRVVLMARVVSVVNGVSWLRSLGWVLLGASLEVLIVAFTGGCSPDIGVSVLAGMSGMRHSPEQSLLLDALSTALIGALCLSLALFVFLLWKPWVVRAHPFPPRVAGDRKSTRLNSSH